MPRGIYLTPEQKEQIVALYKTGLTQCEVAERFGVSQNTVSRVVHPSGYDRTHIGSQIARSIPVANEEPRKGPSEPVQRETAKTVPGHGPDAEAAQRGHGPHLHGLHGNGRGGR